jgi:hypothetical protein
MRTRIANLQGGYRSAVAGIASKTKSLSYCTVTTDGPPPVPPVGGGGVFGGLLLVLVFFRVPRRLPVPELLFPEVGIDPTPPGFGVWNGFEVFDGMGVNPNPDPTVLGGPSDPSLATSLGMNSNSDDDGDPNSSSEEVLIVLGEECPVHPVTRSVRCGPRSLRSRTSSCTDRPSLPWLRRQMLLLRHVCSQSGSKSRKGD